MNKNVQEISEQEIIARCKRGDRSAFQVLVERYERRAYGIAFGMLRSREDAMDAAQDAFVKVFRNIGSFKGDSSFYTWFYRIVKNVCIDHCRKKSRAKLVEYDETYRRKDEDPGEYFRKLIYVAASRANFGTSILTSKRLGDAI